MYYNCCCSCSLEPEIIKNGQSLHKMYNNNILNLQVSMTILNACTKKSGNLLKVPRGLILPCATNIPSRSSFRCNFKKILYIYMCQKSNKY